ncbi:MAG: IS66 family transposase [Okeania sp. SIO2B9]|nr:IS66 family transposase [Okeania sp. SIO2B9]
MAQRQRLSQVEKELEEIKESLRKLSERSSRNSSQPPSQDGYKKKNKSSSKPGEPKVRKKRGPKYGHGGTTRNGFEFVAHTIEVPLTTCPVCGAELERRADRPVKSHQVAELVPQPVEVWEYQRPEYACPVCDFQGHAELPYGIREDFSYGALLSSLVGWLGYGGHLSWAKQRFLVETIFGIPLSQGSLAKMHQWFCKSLYPSYEQWWTWIQQPGVRCVDETSYRLDGVTYWMWIATSSEVCILLLAPTRSSQEVNAMLGEDFEGILSSDCWSAYGPQKAMAKQKCLAHIERELKAMETSKSYQINKSSYNSQSNRLFLNQLSGIHIS